MDTKYWLSDPEDHDFPAAKDFLELVFPSAVAEDLTKRLRASETITRKAKDILRASRLPLLDQDNVHVQSNLEKIKNKKKLSPVLLVAGETLIIADGYHRLCAIYFLSEDLDVPCRLIHPDEIEK
jgi:disulfide oxidoreductase YuzD